MKLKVEHKNYSLPDKDGFFGEFGGMYVDDNFKPVLEKLNEDFPELPENFKNYFFSKIIISRIRCIYFTI